MPSFARQGINDNSNGISYKEKIARRALMTYFLPIKKDIATGMEGSDSVNSPCL